MYRMNVTTFRFREITVNISDWNLKALHKVVLEQQTAHNLISGVKHLAHYINRQQILQCWLFKVQHQWLKMANMVAPYWTHI